MIGALSSGNACAGCGQVVVPGALACLACGLPVALQVATPPPLAVQTGTVRELIVVEGGTVGTRIPAPPEGVELILGRHDLTRSPPWVVDVDLGRLMALSTGEGPPVSRDQAALSRRAGQVLITPRGQAPVLHRAQGGSFQPLQNGTAQPLKTGDRLAFGHGSRALVVEVN
ncbi:MAG: hypothetical protein AB2A00_18975 [Myxococcota bacterium]